jgi:hypothetical protein
MAGRLLCGLLSCGVQATRQLVVLISEGLIFLTRSPA